MGIYINKGNEGFRSAINGTYVDKSGLIAEINQTLDTERRCSCLTRCRRFGKTMALNMLRAYYDKSCDSRELATGKGFADLVFLPRKNVDKPAMVLELKYNKASEAAIDQIKRKEYTSKILEYTGEILLVGINYDKQTKLHSCKIERVEK